jgi:hypothetical protein
VVALGRGRVPGLRVDQREVDLVAGPCGEDFQKRALRAAIAVEKAVDGIQLADMFGGARRERIGARP